MCSLLVFYIIRFNLLHCERMAHPAIRQMTLKLRHSNNSTPAPQLTCSSKIAPHPKPPSHEYAFASEKSLRSPGSRYSVTLTPLRRNSHKRSPARLVQVKLIRCTDYKRRPVRCRICRRAGDGIRGRAVGILVGIEGLSFVMKLHKMAI